MFPRSQTRAALLGRPPTLTTAQVEGEFVPACMQQLKRIADATSCSIVVSSTWRESPISLRALLLRLQVPASDASVCQCRFPPFPPLCAADAAGSKRASTQRVWWAAPLSWVHGRWKSFSGCRIGAVRRDSRIVFWMTGISAAAASTRRGWCSATAHARSLQRMRTQRLRC